MKYNLKHMFGWLTIACLVAFVLRRFIPLLFASAATDFWHCVCSPWYVDLYILGVEGCWTFEGSSFQKIHDNYGPTHALYFFSTLASGTIFGVAHAVLVMVVVSAIQAIFFTEPTPVKDTSFDPYDQPEPGNHD